MKVNGVGRALFMAGIMCASGSFAFTGVTKCPVVTFDLAGGIINPQFAGTPGNCPTSWVCGGSPAPGFGSYMPGPLQYPSGHPFSTAAFSPTVLGGSGTIRQLTPMIWEGGTTYRMTLWVGYPITEPGGVTTVAGFPSTDGGAVRLYLTFGSGFGQVTAWDIPAPPRGSFVPYSIAFTLPTNSPAVGQQIGVLLFVSAPSLFAANFDISSSACPI
jgi:hypothetical protein